MKRLNYIYFILFTTAFLIGCGGGGGDSAPTPNPSQNNAPVFTSATLVNVNENQTNAITLVASDEDNDTILYGIDDTITFDINSSSGVVTFKNAPDFETKTQYKFMASASDGTVVVNQEVIINIVNDINETANDAATDISIDINNTDENNAINAKIGTLSSNDPDDPDANLTYTIEAGNNGADFNITNHNELRILVQTNYEVKNSYSVTIKVTDDDGANYSETLTININDINDVATFTNNNLLLTIRQDEAYSYTANIHDEDVNSTLTELPHTIPNGLSTTTTNNNTSDINISLAGSIGDALVGINTITLNVKENDTNAIITQSFDLNVTELNDKPINESAVVDVNISYGEDLILQFVINDGDAHSEENITVTIDSNDTSYVTALVTPNNIINRGTIALTLTGVEPGDSNISISLVDDGGLDNSGENNTTFSFNAHVRANGLKIYKNQKDSNYTENNISFDSINYTWNITNRWYDTNDRILMPVEILKSAKSAYLAGNVKEEAEGHYYVLKSEYLHDINKSQEHNASILYRDASGGSNSVTANNDNFQHDAYHNFFVSMVTRDSVGNLVDKFYADWIDGDMGNTNSYNFVEANDTNQSYTTAESFSKYYTDSSDSNYVSYNVYVDANNSVDSNVSECAKMYGSGWRLPSAHEVGPESDEKSRYSPLTPSMVGYIPAYIGNNASGSNYIFTSTRYGGDDAFICLSLENAAWGYRGFNQTSKIRCIYQP